jgi:hypothetical protein
MPRPSNGRIDMFTFANPNTPIIPSGTSVSHNGTHFTITGGVCGFLYMIETDGKAVAYIPMGGHGLDWQAGVDAVETFIRAAA